MTAAHEHESRGWREYRYATESYLLIDGRIRPSDARGISPADPARFEVLAAHASYPRASRYDPRWVYLNHMGPNVLWIAEALTQVVDLEPGMRILDLGCGTALSSIFLAREFGAQVWATDLWVHPSENWPRICEAGVADRVVPIHAEAHALPFADGFFDAIVSFDAYHYFGTDVRYLAYVSRFARPGATIGIVVPGNEVDADEIPADLAPLVGGHGGDFFTFRSARWWQRLWEQSGVVDIIHADMVPDGWSTWYQWMEASAAWSGHANPALHGDGPLLTTASGRTLGLARVAARVRRER